MTAPIVSRAHAPVVDVPIELANNHAYVPVTVGGDPLWFVVDTGAGYTFLDLTTASRIPGVTLGASFEAQGAGGGTSRGASLAGATVSLRGETSSAAANHRIPDVAAMPIPLAMDLAALTSTSGRAMDGILGFDFISRGVIELDYRAERLRIYESASFRYVGPGTRVPLRMVMHHPHVNAEIELDDGGRLSGDFVIDIGSSRCLALCKPFVDNAGLRTRVGPTVHRPAGRGVGGAVWAESGRAKRLHIGGVALDRPIVNLYGDNAGVFSTTQYFEGNIGGEVLRRFRVFLDYSRAEMILEPYEPITPFEMDMSGLTYEWDAHALGMRLTHVLAASPGAQAGLAPGDVIIRIDQRDAADVGMTALDARFRQDATTVRLTVRRDASQHEVSVHLQRLV